MQLDSQGTRVKAKNMEEIADERMKQIGVSGGAKEQDELKRKREDFAVQLRKNKRYATKPSIFH